MYHGIAALKTWVNIENVMFNERRNYKVSYCLILSEMSRMGKSIEAERRLVIIQSWESLSGSKLGSRLFLLGVRKQASTNGNGGHTTMNMKNLWTSILQMDEFLSLIHI